MFWFFARQICKFWFRLIEDDEKKFYAFCKRRNKGAMSDFRRLVESSRATQTVARRSSSSADSRNDGLGLGDALGLGGCSCRPSVLRLDMRLCERVVHLLHVLRSLFLHLCLLQSICAFSIELLDPHFLSRLWDKSYLNRFWGQFVDAWPDLSRFVQNRFNCERWTYFSFAELCFSLGFHAILPFVDLCFVPCIPTAAQEVWRIIFAVSWIRKSKLCNVGNLRERQVYTAGVPWPSCSLPRFSHEMLSFLVSLERADSPFAHHRLLRCLRYRRPIFSASHCRSPVRSLSMTAHQPLLDSLDCAAGSQGAGNVLRLPRCRIREELQQDEKSEVVKGNYVQYYALCSLQPSPC